jgi:hypothetical protein
MATKKRPLRDKAAARALRIAVKLRQHAPKQLTELPSADKALEAKLGQPIGTLPLLPLIESVDPKRISEMVDRARRIDPALEFEPPDFSRWYQIICPADINPDELARALRQIEMASMQFMRGDFREATGPE